MADETAVAVRGESGDALAAIARAAVDPTVDVAKMQALLDLQERLVKHAAEVAFHGAMGDAQSEMVPIWRGSKNDHTGSPYAKLEAIDAKIRPIYTRHGFSLTFNSPPPVTTGNVRVTCEALHRGGHAKQYEAESPPDMFGAKGAANKTAVQGFGSTVSYLRRYLTLMIFNIALTNEDDDGNGGREVSECLTEQQVNNVVNMIAAAELADDRIPALLAFAGNAKSIEDIRQTHYKRLMDKLKIEEERVRGVRR